MILLIAIGTILSILVGAIIFMYETIYWGEVSEKESE
jgi:hypothetical protein